MQKYCNLEGANQKIRTLPSDVSRDPVHVLVALVAVETSVCCGIAVSGGPVYDSLCKINFNIWQC